MSSLIKGFVWTLWNSFTMLSVAILTGLPFFLVYLIGYFVGRILRGEEMGQTIGLIFIALLVTKMVMTPESLEGD